VIDVITLTDGGQHPIDVARRVEAFLSTATRTMDLALYDFDLSDEVGAPIVGAIRRAAARGVAVRLAVNRDTGNPIPVPPPPSTEPDLLEACGVPVRWIPGVPDLMHHKYVVLDGHAIWTGSTNWTDDSWRREENLILVVDSEGLAASFRRNFDELWSSEQVQGTGEFDTREVALGNGTARAWFSPGRGRRLAHRIAGAIGAATLRVRVCSPVITAGPILGTLAEVAGAGRVDVAGVYDATQMREVNRQWAAEGRNAWKIEAFRNLVAVAPFGGKRSTPYAPGSIHDYMHAKVTVADDVVFAGSYNLSHSGEENAENVLEIRDPALAERLAEFIDQVRARYPQPAAGRG
jgi:phosphatidylserine/phosphatidylglycerophosphate/cardiolipin synthase-like enzyme